MGQTFMKDISPSLYSIDDYPEESLKQFVSDVDNGVMPSIALRNFIELNSCKKLDSLVIFDLLRHAYQDINIAKISGLIHDSGYPFGAVEDMNDSKFDEIVIQACETPLEW